MVAFLAASQFSANCLAAEGLHFSNWHYRRTRATRMYRDMIQLRSPQCPQTRLSAQTWIQRCVHGRRILRRSTNRDSQPPRQTAFLRLRLGQEERELLRPLSADTYLARDIRTRHESMGNLAKMGALLSLRKSSVEISSGPASRYNGIQETFHPTRRIFKDRSGEMHHLQSIVQFAWRLESSQGGVAGASS